MNRQAGQVVPAQKRGRAPSRSCLLLSRNQRLLSGQRQGSEIRVVLVLEVTLAPVGAVVWDVGVDPGDDLDELLAGEIRSAGGLANLLDELAAMRTVCQRRHGQEMGGAVVACPVVDQAAADEVIKGAAEFSDRHADKVQAALGLLAAVTTDAMLVERRLNVGREIDHPRTRISRLRPERLRSFGHGLRSGACGAWR